MKNSLNFKYSLPKIRELAYWLLPVIDYIKLLIFRPKVVIHGSYFTTNVGDRSIALTLKGELSDNGIKSLLVSRFCKNPRVPNIIVGGGGIIHNNYQENLLLRTSFAYNDSNVIYIGIGCPGFGYLAQDDRDHIGRMSNARYISVRDKYSADILNELICIRLDVFACPSWHFPKYVKGRDFSLRNTIFRIYYNLKFYKPNNINRIDGNNIGLALNGHFDQKWLPNIKDMINQLSKNNNLYFIPFVGEDLEFYRCELASLNIKCLKLQNSTQTYRAVEQMDKMIVMRYHSMIFSILLNKPIMILAYSQKIISLAEELGMHHTNLMDGNIKVFKFTKADMSMIEHKINQAQMQFGQLMSHLDYIG